MKKIYKISIALCLSLAILFLTIGPAAAEDTIGAYPKTQNCFSKSVFQIMDRVSYHEKPF